MIKKGLNELNIVEAAEGLKKGEFTSLELTKACLKAVEEKNKDINAFITVTEDLALKQAMDSDKRRAKGQTLGELDGIPCAIKDNLNIKGVRTTVGSKMLENFEAVEDAFVIKKLREAGSVFLGKTNMDEFAMGSSTETSYFGPTKNPHDLERVPGGSSGGSAAAVAANMCIYALGSDTGGSIRQPAAYCGVVGLKPTYGAVSRNGLLAMASSLDQIGPMTKTVEDAETVLKLILEKDENDSTSTGLIEKTEYNRLKIGYLSLSSGDTEIAQAVENIAKKVSAAQIGKEYIEEIDSALVTYYIIMPVEVSSNLGRYDGVKYGFQAEDAIDLMQTYRKSRGEGFGPEVKRRIMLGAYASSEGFKDQYYGKAQKVRARLVSKFDELFKKYDLILLPTTPDVAFKLGEHKDDPISMYLEDLFTIPANLLGVPAISIPVARNEAGLPVAVQIMGARLSDFDVLDFAKQIEKIGG